MSKQTIRNCFGHVGFFQTEIEEKEQIEKPSDLDDNKYEEWMEIDNDVHTNKKMTEESICTKILEEKNNERRRWGA